jgi:hypothetical protein
MKALSAKRITPTLPHIDSLPARALARLLAGKQITHKDFQGQTASYRLASYIETLRNRHGWAIESRWEEGLTSDRTGRRARYVRYLIEPLTLMEIKKQLGTRLDEFIKAVNRFEQGGSA